MTCKCLPFNWCVSNAFVGELITIMIGIVVNNFKMQLILLESNNILIRLVYTRLFLLLLDTYKYRLAALKSRRYECLPILCGESYINVVVTTEIKRMKPAEWRKVPLLWNSKSISSLRLLYLNLTNMTYFMSINVVMICGIVHAAHAPTDIRKQIEIHLNINVGARWNDEVLVRVTSQKFL